MLGNPFECRIHCFMEQGRFYQRYEKIINKVNRKKNLKTIKVGTPNTLLVVKMSNAEIAKLIHESVDHILKGLSIVDQERVLKEAHSIWALKAYKLHDQAKQPSQNTSPPTTLSLTSSFFPKGKPSGPGGI